MGHGAGGAAPLRGVCRPGRPKPPAGGDGAGDDGLLRGHDLHAQRGCGPGEPRRDGPLYVWDVPHHHVHHGAPVCKLSRRHQLCHCRRRNRQCGHAHGGGTDRPAQGHCGRHLRYRGDPGGPGGAGRGQVGPGQKSGVRTVSGPICRIVGAGDFFSRELPSHQNGDLLIAADGGYDHVRKLGLEPDFVVGDFDSLSEPPDRAGVLRLPKEKDDTDMLSALRLGIGKGYREFRLYGGTGGRMDHTVANFQCLVWLAGQGLHGALYGERWTAEAVTNGALTFGAERRGYVSVFSQGDRAEGVWLKGLKYSLADAVLSHDFPLGVSNEFTGVECSISVKTGTLLVIYDDETISGP
ncbi:MAG: thiamine diphosphokinase [Clostridia bacterium]|nr:thiamine diphosphokinase [Clostridia bacterium]